MTRRDIDVEPTLAGRVVTVPETRQLDVLAGLLERRGATVVRCPLVGIRDAPAAEPVLAWLQRRLEPRDGDIVVFYTGEGIERLLGFAERAGLASDFVAALGKTEILTRGPKPKRVLRKLGLAPALEALEPTTSGLIARLATVDLDDRRVAVQLYNADDRPALLDYLHSRGVDPDCVAPYVYASAAESRQVVALIERLARGEVDAIAFTSKAQIERLRRVAREHGMENVLAQGLGRTRIAAIGPVVAAELGAAGLRVARAASGLLDEASRHESLRAPGHRGTLKPRPSSRRVRQRCPLPSMTQLQRGRAAVTRGLIPDREIGQRRPEGSERIVAFVEIESVEAGSDHEMQLLHEHVADRAHFAVEAVALAQQSRIRIRATVAELRKFERNDGQMLEIPGNELGRLLAAQTNPDGCAAPHEIGSMRLPLLDADDDGTRRR